MVVFVFAKHVGFLLFKNLFSMTGWDLLDNFIPACSQSKNKPVHSILGYKVTIQVNASETQEGATI
jgi:hypothetical protein